MPRLTASGAVDTTLGRAVTYSLGDERVLIGIRRAGDWRAPAEREAPSAYIRRETTARSVKRHERPLSADALRRLARDLASYADDLDAWTATHAAELEPDAAAAWEAERRAEAERWLATSAAA